MDANGLSFRMLSTAQDWLPSGLSNGNLYYCSGSGCLRLRSMRNGPAPTKDFATAQARIETSPMARDQFGNYARWDAAGKTVVAGGAVSGEVTIYTPPAGQAVTDLSMGTDGVLYLAVGGTLVLVDRRNRWPNATLALPDFTFWRLAALPEGGVMALDRTTPQLGKVEGLPLQLEPSDTPNPGILRSCQSNANPPQVTLRVPLPSTEAFVAFGAMAAGSFCLLSWKVYAATNTTAYLRTYSPTTGLASAWTFSETVFPFAVSWLGAEKFAVFATGLKEALIYDLTDSPAALSAAGETYILNEQNPGPFVHGFDAPTWYASAAGGAAMYPLVPLSLNSFAGFGEIDDKAPLTIDGGSAQTVWHRLYLEAILPPRCGVTVLLAASNNPSDFTGGTGAAAVEWYPHVFGSASSALPSATETPQAMWVSTASEVAFAKPLLSGTPLKDRQGLFMTLIQRGGPKGTAVRNLTGRYLGIRVQLKGDRRSTPEIAALRVYSPRFSYVNHYLPELYRENKFGADADVKGESTRRDFFERFVNIFEAQMTRIEDRVAGAYLLTRPESTPDSALDWLGGWIGVESANYPSDRKRAHVLAAASLHKKRGTVKGITEALNVATNGLCKRGAVIVLEDFRMRHIFATILGADLTMANDPLLPGLTASTNSFVGDTLFLGDPRNPDFLALYASSVLTSKEQQEAEQFLDSLAYRITIFIHNQVDPVNLTLVKQIVEREKPAHVAATYRVAEQPFMIGMASLLGVNCYLAPEPPAEDPVIVQNSRVGRYNVIQHVPSLDPRYENGEANVM
jgi:phage tail-like protein